LPRRSPGGVPGGLPSAPTIGIFCHTVRGRRCGAGAARNTACNTFSKMLHARKSVGN
jgi:hypothetical protein